jgi:hypothetical protein
LVSTGLRLIVLVKVGPIIVSSTTANRSGILGGFTFDRYGHLYDDAESEVADRLAALPASRPARHTRAKCGQELPGREKDAL